MTRWGLSDRPALAKGLTFLLGSFLFLEAAKPTVNVAPMDSVGPREVEQQTRAAIVRDYLQAWQCMNSALEHNQAESLDPCFVGQAKDILEAI